mmetsp:Transcript_18460/g.52742  ORF Transcript_18460/g.52742 Transcript_18460/m.52742 type:complete len:282 (-) Transcript_18460:113-958(-)
MQKVCARSECSNMAVSSSGMSPLRGRMDVYSLPSMGEDSSSRRAAAMRGSCSHGALLGSRFGLNDPSSPYGKLTSQKRGTRFDGSWAMSSCRKALPSTSGPTMTSGCEMDWRSMSGCCCSMAWRKRAFLSSWWTVRERANCPKKLSLTSCLALSVRDRMGWVKKASPPGSPCGSVARPAFFLARDTMSSATMPIDLELGMKKRDSQEYIKDAWKTSRPLGHLKVGRSSKMCLLLIGSGSVRSSESNQYRRQCCMSGTNRWTGETRPLSLTALRNSWTWTPR